MALNFCTLRIGEVLANMWWRAPDDGYYFSKEEPRRFIISFHGLPGHPFQMSPESIKEYLDDGFILVYPDYIGTWASDGQCTFDNCLDTAISAFEYVESGRGISQWDLTEFSWQVRDITLLGGSFGAAVALTAAAKLPAARNVIAIAGPTDFRTLGKGKYAALEENLDDAWAPINRVYSNLWRIRDKADYDRLADGRIDLNAIDYVAELKDRNIFLIHGECDKSVSVMRSLELFDRICGGVGQKEILILQGEGHLANDVIGKASVRSHVSKWLSHVSI